ncbi:MAG: alginate lyase, partial [Planctomycetes bacterium]|nr:alginate lyase [Planctomycetota bacterium]
TGDQYTLALCRVRFKEVFLPDQMALDGSFPQELRRTKPYGYAIFQLDNMVSLCQLLSTDTDNLWTFSLPDGRSITKAVAWLHPFLKDKSSWPLPQDVQYWDEWPVRQPTLLFAGLAENNTEYLDLWKHLESDPTNLEVRRNMAVTQPLLWILAAPKLTPDH